MRMRKLIISTFLLVASSLVWGQSTQYVSVSTSNGIVNLKNVSGQGIVFVYGNITINGKVTGHYAHDYFFQQGGWTAGGTMQFDTTGQGIYNYSVVPTYIQFEDGSSWGDKTTAQARLDKRAAKLSYLRQLVTSANTGSLTLATAAKGSVQESVNLHIADMESSVGVAGTVTYLREMLATADARINSGKF